MGYKHGRDLAIERFTAEINTALDAVKSIADRAKGGRLTPDEARRAEELLASASGAREQRDMLRREAEKGADVMRQIRDLGSLDEVGGWGSGYSGSKGGTGGVWATKVIDANSDGLRYKGLTPSGSVLVPVPAPQPVELGRPVTSLRQVVPFEPSAGQFRYLRQDVRDNQAAVVAAGARKPTSDYTLTPVEDRVRVIAHLSNPISRMDLADAPTLVAFIEAELFYGVERALEAEIIGGDGTGEHFTGLANTSGVQTQPYATSPITTTRKALTKLEVAGLTGTAWVMHPSDFEAIELSATDDGALVLAGAGSRVPIDSAARRLWGVPVVATPAATVGTAWLGDFAGSTRGYVTEDVNLTWSENVYDPDALGTGVGASDFERNMTRFRAEGRFGFAVTRPSGIVKISLTA